jgi:hypothetical protein
MSALGGRDSELRNEQFCGMTWGWTGVRGTWATPAAVDSLGRLGDLNVNWVGISFGALQATAHSTDIRFGAEPTVTDDEVRWAIREAKRLGHKVCLKPVVNVADGTWRAFIGFFDEEVPGEPSWAQWFASYGRFILHYAAIAQEEGVEMLCVGCEMVQTDKRETQWRALVSDVRLAYDGLVTYNCDKYQEDRVTWWDAVDIISSSGYYPLGDWDNQLDRIQSVVEREGKPFFFMESGCPSREGSPARPNDWMLQGEPSEDAQAEWYRDAFETCARRDWVQGFMLWDWPAELYAVEDAAANDDYCVYGKSAADVVRDHYAERLAGRTG